MKIDEATLYRIYANLHSATRQSWLFIEPTDNQLPQEWEEPLDNGNETTIRKLFAYNINQLHIDGRPAIRIADSDKMIAVAFNSDNFPDFRLIDILRQIGISAERSHWNSDYESYYIALRKYPYIQWCIDNQEYTKLAQYIRQEY